MTLHSRVERLESEVVWLRSDLRIADHRIHQLRHVIYRLAVGLALEQHELDEIEKYLYGPHFVTGIGVELVSPSGGNTMSNTYEVVFNFDDAAATSVGSHDLTGLASNFKLDGVTYAWSTTGDGTVDGASDGPTLTLTPGLIDDVISVAVNCPQSDGSMKQFTATFDTGDVVTPPPPADAFVSSIGIRPVA